MVRTTQNFELLDKKTKQNKTKTKQQNKTKQNKQTNKQTQNKTKQKQKQKKNGVFKTSFDQALTPSWKKFLQL